MKVETEMFAIEKIGNGDSNDSALSFKFKISKVKKGIRTKKVIDETSSVDFNKDETYEKNSEAIIRSSSLDKENISTMGQILESENKSKFSNGSSMIEEDKTTSSSPLENSDKENTVKLRRTSRRIILRVQKDFLSDIKNIKKEKKNVKKAKTNDLRKLKKDKKDLNVKKDMTNVFFKGFAKRKKEKKDELLQTDLPEKKKYSKRGRPRKVIESPSLSLGNKANVIFGNNCHSLNPDLKAHQFEDSFEQNSSIFQKNFQLQNHALLREQFQLFSYKQENKFKIPCEKFLPRREKNYSFKVPPSKPTVIYFKPTNKRTNVSIPQHQTPQFYRSDQSYLNDQPIVNVPYQEQVEINYLRQKYSWISPSLLDYFYDVGNGNLFEIEKLLREFLTKEIKIFSQGISSSTEFMVETSDENIESLSRINKEIPENTRLSVSPVFDEIDTLHRQVIVDSIRLLYDEDSVLGYL